MRNVHRLVPLALAGSAAVMVAVPGPAGADVTIQQQTSFDLAIIKAHGTSTEATTADKQRRDSDLHCEGFMSLLCGNTQSGEIVRLDRDLQWTLEPKKKEYRETRFLTAEQRQVMQQQAQEMMEKMKQCPAMQRPAQGPDTSKCDMSPPRIDVKASDKHATFAGHDARLTQIALTQSCRNRDSGDVCDFVFALDSWLTQDQIAGLDEHNAFQRAYLKKLGLDAGNPLVQKQMRQFLAQYSDALKQLAAKSGDLKGYPLRSVVRIAYGGEHCAAAKGHDTSAAGGGSGGGEAGPMTGSAAASALASKLGGLFKKKQTESAPAQGATAAPEGALPPGMLQAAAFTVETTSIAAGPVPANQFEIPPDWKLIVPKEKPAREFSCPKAGS